MFNRLIKMSWYIQSNFHVQILTRRTKCKNAQKPLNLGLNFLWTSLNAKDFLWGIPYRNLLQWLSRIIDVFGPIITKLRFSGPISYRMQSSNKTNCVRDHKNLIIGPISWLFADYSWFSWLFSDYHDYSVIIDDYAWLFNTNHDYSPQIGWPLERMVNKQI